MNRAGGWAGRKVLGGLRGLWARQGRREHRVGKKTGTGRLVLAGPTQGMDQGAGGIMPFVLAQPVCFPKGQWPARAAAHATPEGSFCLCKGPRERKVRAHCLKYQPGDQ